MNRLIVEKRNIGYRDFRVVVILVNKGETEDQAWRRHVLKNPFDRRSTIKIFHFPFQEIS